jgi:hypothetical protein
MPPERILPGQFMHVSKEVRDYLAAMWKIPRSGITEIRDQDVISDGHTYEDLASITHEMMNKFVGSEESFARAWELTVMKAYSELHPPVGTIGGDVEKQLYDDTPTPVSEELKDIVDDTVTTVEVPEEIAPITHDESETDSKI